MKSLELFSTAGSLNKAAMPRGLVENVEFMVFLLFVSLCVW